MDERLLKALDFSNYMVTLNNKKRLLKEKYEEDLLFFINGCQFTVTKELINFVNMLVEKDLEEAVLTDDNGIPTRITDLETFLSDVMDVYFTASNKYFTEYDKLRNSRRMESLVDYDKKDS